MKVSIAVCQAQKINSAGQDIRPGTPIGMYLEEHETENLFNRLNQVENYVENHFYRANGGCGKTGVK